MTGTTTRGRTGRGRLLLFVALLFGIVGMHTLGHPSGHSGSGHMTASSAAASASVPRPDHSGGAMAGPHAGSATSAGQPMPGDGGMDPLGVCLAVLGSVTLLLLTALVLRPLTARHLLPRPRGMACAQRPNPPPPRTLLARLSVLRI
ncbi:DUF6153 family protein [Streptomyces sp. NPDC059524]|uniref:DUF6153 family protein n=1 Tax=Streptomyces sp. NPDC059524 TaxID=3346856 RepID=UPI0036A84C01